MSSLIDIASAELGVTEISGAEHNERILQYAREAGFSWYKSDETSWCSVFLNWVAHRAGLDRSNDARAHSWVNIGQTVTHPVPGDLVLLSSNGVRVYHVGIFTGLSDNGRSVFVLGGNQSNRVSIAPFPLSHVMAYKRIDVKLAGRSDDPERDAETPKNGQSSAEPRLAPTAPAPSKDAYDSTGQGHGAKADEVSLPNIKLRYGQQGKPVEQLQEVLVLLGFLKGRADGVFGPKTAKALQLVQFKGRIRPSGTYNRKTRDYLAALLQRI